ncbi:hypothetical protein TNCV_3059341 [Trichonephila clavipes]|nr:hypothetical protein TNCV_3059341 [Trichonephila clavipes]
MLKEDFFYEHNSKEIWGENITILLKMKMELLKAVNVKQKTEMEICKDFEDDRRYRCGNGNRSNTVWWRQSVAKITRIPQLSEIIGASIFKRSSLSTVLKYFSSRIFFVAAKVFVGGEISVSGLAALIRKAYSYLELISLTVRSFLTKQIFNSSAFAIPFGAACKQQILCYAREIIEKSIPAPEDFYLFPWLKMKLKGRRFVDSDEVIQNATKQLKDLVKIPLDLTLRTRMIWSVRRYNQKSSGRPDSDDAWNSLRSARFLAYHVSSRQLQIFERFLQLTEQVCEPGLLNKSWWPVFM